MDQRNFVIVGAGVCGSRAAFALREQGFKGNITLIGAEPEDPYERPPLSKHFMLERDETGHGRVTWITTAERMAAAAINYLPATDAQALNTQQHCLTIRQHSGESTALHYDRLLLATGATPRQLPLSQGGANNDNGCYYLRTLADAQAIQSQLATAQHITIVGGGLIGMELAASARTLGVAVTVLEAEARILGRAVPSLLAQQLAERHQQEGVDLRCGVQIHTITPAASPTDTAASLTTTLSNNEQLHTTLLVIGIGATPNQVLATQAGLDVGNGIVVDAYLQTSAPDVFAAGDCCCFPDRQGNLLRLETWRNAHAQGTQAARNMLGENEAYREIPWFWSEQYDWGLQVVGLSNPHHTTVVRHLQQSAKIQFELDDTGTLVAAAGLGTGQSVAKTIRLTERLISLNATPNQAQLADATLDLKTLLR